MEKCGYILRTKREVIKFEKGFRNFRNNLIIGESS